MSGVRVGPSFSPRGATGTSAVGDPAHTSLLTDTGAPPPAPPGAVTQDRLLSLDFGHFHFSLAAQSTWSGPSPRETPRKRYIVSPAPHFSCGALSLAVSLGLWPSPWVSGCLPGSLAVSHGLPLALALCPRVCVWGGGEGGLSLSPGPSRSLAAPGLWLQAEPAVGARRRAQPGSGRSGRSACLSRRRIDPAAAPPAEIPGPGNEPPHTPLAKHTAALAPAVNI